MNAEALSGKVLGTCTLQKMLGRGGMGAVFLAQQSRPRRQVAVKVLLPISALQPRQRAAFLERFRRETDAAASLEHPNIVPVHEYGEQDGLAYLVMAYISGGTLRDALEREGKLSLIQAVSYLEQMSDALDFAHERGVIHRDVKPANILITPEKRLVLTDFGLVKIVADEERTQMQLSDVGMPMGTPDYMSPEQVVGKEIDARADLYSLGVILYQMITGSVPFKGEMPMKVALQHLHTPAPSPRLLRPDLPVAAESVILRALAKNPEDRYAHTGDFVTAFRLALEQGGVALADAQGNTGAVRAMKVDRNANNRPRGLFDPVWRGHHGHQGHAAPQVNNQPQVTKRQEEVAQSAVKQTKHTIGSADAVVAVKEVSNSQREQQRKSSEDIVAKTSMTMPSFSGLLSQTLSNQPVSSLLETHSALVTSSTNTPLPDINIMEEQPTNEIPQQYNQAKKDTNGGNAPARNSLLSPNRLRPGHKTNLLGEGPEKSASNPAATRQLSPAAPGFNEASGNPPSTSTTGMLNSGRKTGQLRSYATNHMKPAPNNPVAPGIPNVPNSVMPSVPSTPPGSTDNWPNYPLSPGQVGATGTFNTAQQNPYRPGATGTFNNVNAQASNASMAGTGGITGSFNLYNSVPGTTGATGVWKTQTGALIPVNPPGATGSFMIPSGNESTGQTGMLRLTQSVKVIKVPLAGQPGQYVTGLLPVLATPNSRQVEEEEDLSLKERIRKNMKVLILVAAVVVLLFGSVIFLVMHNSSPTPRFSRTVTGSTLSKLNKAATVAAQASATAQANIIVADQLASPIHSWPSKDNYGTYTFQDGAYHIKATSDADSAVALLTSPLVADKFVYTISLNEVGGLDNSTDANKVNTFGLIFRLSDGQNLSYYAFLIDPNSANPSYEFQKYDAAHKANDDPRVSLWTGKIGDEYHLKHGVNNTIKISANGAHFTFNVNGKDVGSKDDKALTMGQIGMIVNLKDTEIAFSNLLVTHQ